MARYDPFEEMDRMFEQLRTRTWTPSRTDFGMSALGGGTNMDLKKHGDEYVFVADLPGFETDEINLTFEDGALVLVAETSLREETTSDRMGGDEPITAERTTDETMDEEMPAERTSAATDEMTVRREFTRSRRVAERVTVPEEIVEDEITATYRNGVLEVHLPLVGRDADEDDGRKIDIAD